MATRHEIASDPLMDEVAALVARRIGLLHQQPAGPLRLGLLGLSLGSMVVAEWARLHPREVAPAAAGLAGTGGPGAHRCVHPEAGHDLPLDAGPWLAQTVADWCKHTV